MTRIPERDLAFHAFDTLRSRLGVDTPAVSFGGVTLSHHEWENVRDDGTVEHCHNARVTRDSGAVDSPAVWLAIYDEVARHAAKHRVALPSLEYWGVVRPEPVITAEQVDHMADAYIVAALWADCTPLCDCGAVPTAVEGVPMGAFAEHADGCASEQSGGLERLDVDPKSRRYVWALCRYFADLYPDDLQTFASMRYFSPENGTAWDFVGHDLRLTSGGHGTGFWDREAVREAWASPERQDAFKAARAALTTVAQLEPFGTAGGQMHCFQTSEHEACIDPNPHAALLRFRAIANGYEDPETGEAFTSAQRQHWVETGEIINHEEQAS